jgi:hypothetical protein
MTLGYFKNAGPGSTTPSFVIVEMQDSGSVQTALSFTLPALEVRCPLLTSTDSGYALAWQDMVGTWLTVYTAENGLLLTYSVAGAVVFGGAELQPSLGGFASFGADFGLVLAGGAAAELWSLSPMGTRRLGAVGLPTVAGRLGTLSSLPTVAGLYTTYADYAAAAPGADVGAAAAGDRYLLRATCF